jgi:hypothetical protein
MAENEKFEINKVRIADVQSGASDELTEAEQEKVTGGGGYGCPTCAPNPCSCGG